MLITYRTAINSLFGCALQLHFLLRETVPLSTQYHFRVSHNTIDGLSILSKECNVRLLKCLYEKMKKNNENEEYPCGRFIQVSGKKANGLMK